MASCAARLHEMQKDFGFSNKELKQAIREISQPREVELPTFRMSEEAVRREKEISGEKVPKQRKYELAWWYLEEYLKPQYAMEIYMKYLKFKDLVNYAYQCALDLIDFLTFRIRKLTVEEVNEMLAPEELDDFDIPPAQEKEFDDYCEKHPLKDANDVITRRENFKEYRYKKRKKLYSPKRLRMYDPVAALTMPNEKAIIKDLKRIGAENERRVQAFNKFMEKYFPNIAKGSVLMSRFNEQTQHLLDANKKRIDEMVKRMGQPPDPIQISIDNQPTITVW